MFLFGLALCTILPTMLAWTAYYVRRCMGFTDTSRKEVWTASLIFTVLLVTLYLLLRFVWLADLVQ